MTLIRLGLIGDNIAASRAPDLHRYCGHLLSLDVRYDLQIPAREGRSFDAILEEDRLSGFHGVNITLPYKQRVVPLLRIDDPATRRLGAVNTVRFENGVAIGHNTDRSGFVSAYRATFGAEPPGRVMVIGAGGVGNAVAFGLIELAAQEIVVVDPSDDRADALVQALGAAGGAARRGFLGDAETMDGMCNCTPLGMTGYPGTPLPDGAPRGLRWAFDAVYTPVDTEFRAQVETAGAAFLSGFELFFFQGIHAFEIFTGHRVENTQKLRAMLLDPAQETHSP